MPLTHVVSARESSFFVTAEPQTIASLQILPSLQYKESYPPQVAPNNFRSEKKNTKGGMF